MNLLGVEFWKVVVSLGVPGLALGVFYMLFRSFKWTFPVVPRQWVGPIIVLFMVITAGLTSFVLFHWAPSSIKSSRAPAKAQTEKSHLSINYMRLFGAYQVPMLMETIFYHQYGGMPEYYFLISNNLAKNHPLYKFWASWQYSNSKPLKTNLWNEIAKIDRSNLLCISFENDQLAKDYFAFVMDYRISIGEDPKVAELYLKKKYRDLLIKEKIEHLSLEKMDLKNINLMERYIESKSQNVGFLFIIIDNISNDTLENIRLKYKEFQWRDISKTSKTLKFPRHEFDCPKTNVDMSIYPSSKMVSEELRTDTKNHEILLYKLGKGESILWILSAYLKDDSGLPAKYLSNSIVKPTQISYQNASNGNLTEIKVREPWGHKAAALMVPLGWYGQ